VKVAESQLGKGEEPPGSGCTIYGPCEEWCSLFASWVWQHAGVPLPGSTAAYGYSGSLYTWAREHGGRVLPPAATPAPGDAIFYGTGPGDSSGSNRGIEGRPCEPRSRFVDASAGRADRPRQASREPGCPSRPERRPARCRARHPARGLRCLRLARGIRPRPEQCQDQRHGGRGGG
jgi:hypothetical protein